MVHAPDATAVLMARRKDCPETASIGLLEATCSGGSKTYNSPDEAPSWPGWQAGEKSQGGRGSGWALACLLHVSLFHLGEHLLSAGWSLSHAVSYCPGCMELSGCWWWCCRDVRTQRLCLRVRHPSSTHPVKGCKLTVTPWARAELEPNGFASPEARLSVGATDDQGECREHEHKPRPVTEQMAALLWVQEPDILIVHAV